MTVGIRGWGYYDKAHDDIISSKEVVASMVVERAPNVVVMLCWLKGMVV